MDAAELVGALLDDLEEMREHDARLADFHLRTRTAEALRALTRTDGCSRALAAQSVHAIRLYLEAELARPTPPQYAQRDPLVWDLVKEHLAAQLARLPQR